MVVPIKVRRRARIGTTSEHVDSARMSKRLNPAYSTLSVYVRCDTHRRLKAMAALQGRTMSEIAETVIEEWLAGDTGL